MLDKFANYILETLYTTLTAFFYYYIFQTLIAFRPFSFGFHPPINTYELSTALVALFGIVAFVKSLGLISFWVNSERATKSQSDLAPTRR